MITNINNNLPDFDATRFYLALSLILFFSIFFVLIVFIMLINKYFRFEAANVSKMWDLIKIF